jgi:hypothetical protein
MAAPSQNRIGEILVKARVIDDLQLSSALAAQDRRGGRLSRIIADLNLASEEAIAEAICQGLGMQRVHLGTLPRDADALARVDVSLAEQKGLFPVGLKDNGKTLVLAMADPTDLATIDQVAAKSRARVVVVVASELEIEHAILRHYRNQEPATGARLRGARPLTESSEFDDPGDDDEFKVVDMSGKTLVKHISDIAAPGAPAAPSASPTRAAEKSPPPVLGAGSSASEFLDEILAGGTATPEWTEEDLQRLQTVQQNQEKSSKILRALLELLLEKGQLQQRELAAKMRL